MDLKCWWLVFMISTFANGFYKKHCDSFFYIIDILTSCEHDEYKSTFNCTNKIVKRFKISYLPESAKVNKLVLNNCCLKTIEEDAFDRMTALTQLEMSHNSLNVLKYKIFKNTRSLEALNLSYNELESIDYRLFNSTANLRYLNLSHNSLKELDHRLFLQQKQLIHLDMECNKLFILYDERTFSSQSNLVTLLLGNNVIRIIDVNVLKPLNSLKKLELAGNPMVCQHCLRSTVLWCLSRGLETNACCVYPPEFEGKSWNFLNETLNCEENNTTFPTLVNEQNTSVLLDPTEEVENEFLASENVIRRLTIALTCVGLMLVITFVLLSFCCWTYFRRNYTAKLSSLELNGNEYCEAVYNARDNNVTTLPSNRSLPPTASDEGIVYDYVDPTTLQGIANVPTNNIQENSTCNNEYKEVSIQFMPKEKVVENEIYE